MSERQQYLATVKITKKIIITVGEDEDGSPVDYPFEAASVEGVDNISLIFFPDHFLNEVGSVVKTSVQIVPVSNHKAASILEEQSDYGEMISL